VLSVLAERILTDCGGQCERLINDSYAGDVVPDPSKLNAQRSTTPCDTKIERHAITNYSVK